MHHFRLAELRPTYWHYSAGTYVSLKCRYLEVNNSSNSISSTSVMCKIHLDTAGYMFTWRLVISIYLPAGRNILLGRSGKVRISSVTRVQKAFSACTLKWPNTFHCYIQLSFNIRRRKHVIIGVIMLNYILALHTQMHNYHLQNVLCLM